MIGCSVLKKPVSMIDLRFSIYRRILRSMQNDDFHAVIGFDLYVRLQYLIFVYLIFQSLLQVSLTFVIIHQPAPSLLRIVPADGECDDLISRD